MAYAIGNRRRLMAGCFWISSAVIFSTGLVCCAYGQEAGPRRLTLPDALALAERQGYDFLLADAAVRGAQGDVTAARHLVNPLFSGAFVHSTDVPQGGTTTSATGYALTLSDQGSLEAALSGKRRLRIEQAEAALVAAQSNRDDALRLLRFQVVQAFYAVLAAQASADVGGEVASSFAQALELVGVRYRYGAVSEVDLDRIETAKLEAEQTVAGANAAVAEAKATLAFLLGGVSADMELEGSLEGQPPAWLAQESSRLIAEAVTRRGDVAAACYVLDRAHAALELARRERLPDVALSAGYAREGPEGSPVTPPTVTLGAAFELPVFNQRQGEIARAESDRASAQIALDRVSAQAAQDVRSALAAFEAAQEQVGRMTGRLLDRARRARDLIRLQYRAGAISLIDLLDAERTALTVELEYQQDLYSLKTSAAQVATAVGREVTP